jgi:hypothetical protein
MEQTLMTLTRERYHMASYWSKAGKVSLNMVNVTMKVHIWSNFCGLLYDYELCMSFAC